MAKTNNANNNQGSDKNKPQRVDTGRTTNRERSKAADLSPSKNAKSSSRKAK